MLPVPLNSSKMTSSIRLSVSIRAVARIVRLPPSSQFRAAPKKRLGFKQSFGLNTAGHYPAFSGLKRVIAARQPGNAVEKDDDILLEFHETFRPLTHQFCYLNVARRTFIKRGAKNFAIQTLLEIRHLFRAFVHQ